MLNVVLGATTKVPLAKFLSSWIAIHRTRITIETSDGIVVAIEDASAEIDVAMLVKAFSEGGSRDH